MTRSTAGERIMVALDLEAREALDVARSLVGIVRWAKVGMTLFYREGPDIVRRLADLGFEVFVDLKIHDIPHQVELAASGLARLGAGMMTVHAAGGSAMVDAAVRGVRRGASESGVSPPAVVAVTVLTSIDDSGLAAIGVERPVTEQVPLLAGVARAGGADGVVCSPHEAARMRGLFGEAGYVVCPGIRPAGSEADDQARVATPHAALLAGASHLVIGRPITAAASPASAAMRIIDEIEGAKTWQES